MIAPGNAVYQMDVEPLVATAKAANEAIALLLEQLSACQEDAQEDLDEIAEKLATALTDTIQWMPARDAEANQLLGALLRWLP